MKKLFFAAAMAALMSATAVYAEDFHGYDPETHDSGMIAADNLKAMVADAMKQTPPKNGKNYVIGFANLQRDIPFCALVEEGIMANAKAAGIEVVVADNHLDGATALANAESFITRDVDFVIEFQTDANFGATIMKKMNDANIKVLAIDIPMPGAMFFGVNNPRAGFMGGSYLAQAAIAKYGLEATKTGYFIEGELPQSGPIPAMRTGGQVAGFLASVPGFDPTHVLKFDSKNTLEESFTKTNSLLTRVPEGVPVMGTAINDQASTGILRAALQDNRGEKAMIVGLGADEKETLVNEASFIASVGSFPERYGNALIPIALSVLANKEVPDAVLINHIMITKENVCEFYTDQPCVAGGGFGYSFPQAKFEEHLANLMNDETLADVKNLIPLK